MSITKKQLKFYLFDNSIKNIGDVNYHFMFNELKNLLYENHHSFEYEKLLPESNVDYEYLFLTLLNQLPEEINFHEKSIQNNFYI